MEKEVQRNRLQYEKSPYLLQHAGNPVDWWPWGDEAFAAAAAEDKPVFLSIGYSTCHWCHVMERESFEDAQAAALLNDAFICIKVDREERPDIDNVYMAVCQMLTGSGGWPLTILLAPDKTPFYAATYIPKEGRYGRPGLVDIVPRVKELWRTRREELLASGRKHVENLRQLMETPPPAGLSEKPSTRLSTSFRNASTSASAASAERPNSPRRTTSVSCCATGSAADSGRALAMVEKTLHAMRQGGIYDHVGFGFHRYSTDAAWLVPHFEKMLYDQAMCALAYLEAHQATRKAEYGRYGPRGLHLRAP